MPNFKTNPTPALPWEDFSHHLVISSLDQRECFIHKWYFVNKHTHREREREREREITRNQPWACGILKKKQRDTTRKTKLFSSRNICLSNYAQVLSDKDDSASFNVLPQNGKLGVKKPSCLRKLQTQWNCLTVKETVDRDAHVCQSIMQWVSEWIIVVFPVRHPNKLNKCEGSAALSKIGDTLEVETLFQEGTLLVSGNICCAFAEHCSLVETFVTGWRTSFAGWTFVTGCRA